MSGGGIPTRCCSPTAPSSMRSRRRPTEDVTTGIVTHRSAELSTAFPGVARGAIDAVVIGTHPFRQHRSRVQRQGLGRVAAVRIGLPAAASLPPLCDWPADLAERVRGDVFMLEGGHDYDGRPIVPFDEDGMRRASRAIRESGIKASRSPRYSRRSILPAKSGPPRSSPRNALMPPSLCRAIWVASAFSSARMQHC